MGPYRIILADDHVLFRQGLKSILEGRTDFKIVGEAGDGIELVHLLGKLTSDDLVPHLVILDISMPNLRGIEAIPEIKMDHPNVKILIVTMHRDKEYLYQALAAGADGYFLKKDADAELFDAIEKIQRGKIYVASYFSELAEDWEQVRKAFGSTILTTREKEVLKLIAEGKSNKEIAGLLFVSVHTIERHRANIMDKLNLKKTAELVKYAIQKGYI